MKVLHISANAQGGAGRAAWNLHQALLKEGVESDFFSLLENPCPRPSLWTRWCVKAARFIQDRGVDKNRSTLSNTIFKLSLVQQALKLSNFSAYDLIHLHWIATSLSPDLIRQLSQQKPVVWTLHDMWPFTGGCHFSAGCEKFKSLCDECPQLAQSHTPLIKSEFKTKQNAYAAIRAMVAPSQWLKQSAMASKILGSVPAHCIPYSLNLERFFPASTEEGRKKWQIPLDHFVFGFVASDFSENRKGTQLFLQAMDRLLAEHPKLHFLLMGKIPDGGITPHPRVILTGQVHNDADLRQAYACMDAAVIPSLEDNLPNVMLEAAACGRAVVAFDVGGLGEWIPQGLGLVASEPSVDGLVSAMNQIKADAPLREKIKKEAPAFCQLHFAPQAQARAYLNLYKNILGTPAHTTRPSQPFRFRNLSFPEQWRINMSFTQAFILWRAVKTFLKRIFR